MLKGYCGILPIAKNKLPPPALRDEQAAPAKSISTYLGPINNIFESVLKLSQQAGSISALRGC